MVIGRFFMGQLSADCGVSMILSYIYIYIYIYFVFINFFLLRLNFFSQKSILIKVYYFILYLGLYLTGLFLVESDI